VFILISTEFSFLPLFIFRYRTKCREREALAVEYETTEKERNELVHQLSRLKRYQRYLEQTVWVNVGVRIKKYSLIEGGWLGL
jgi:hypothetical protein